MFSQRNNPYCDLLQNVVQIYKIYQMKKILGLDLGTTSIGWAIVNEATEPTEKSSIIKIGVRVNPLSTDEKQNFEKGKSITTNADRTLKRSMRRNLQRYKLRRENLIEIFKNNHFIKNESELGENGNKTTFETYRLRAKAVNERVTLEQLARILLMLNKKRGYKSSRKAKNQEEGQLIDGMEIAKKLYNENITPGELLLNLHKSGKKFTPDFYRSDLMLELNKIWEFQKTFHPTILTDEFKVQIIGKPKLITSKTFLAKYKIYTAENKGTDKKLQAYKWRVDALTKEVTDAELAFVISEINGGIANSSGYLGSISDRSKELIFNKLTVGQYLAKQIEDNPHARLKNQVFYRKDYLDEFNSIWEKQKEFHTQLTEDLKNEIRDVIIFYQRRLKSQKGLVSICEFEQRQIEKEIEGKTKKITIGNKVCPKSSPVFQEFKIWQVLNNIEVIEKENAGAKRLLFLEEKERLFKEISIKSSLTKNEALKLLFKNYKSLDLNFEKIEGNRTFSSLYSIYQNIIELSGHGEYDFTRMDAEETKQIVSAVFETLGINPQLLNFDSSLDGKAFENQPAYQLWHLLYSFEGDNSNLGNEKLVEILTKKYGFEKTYATLLANLSFQPDYGSLCTKAIKNILPHLKEGNEFSVACTLAGYRHSKSSLTKDEKEQRVLIDKLEILPKNALRNPVVEKILNQMINLVNMAIANYGKPDEIRIELARELKKSAKEREELTTAISKSTKDHEEYKAILMNEFGLVNVSRNDIIRYKLYLELGYRGYKTLYSDTYIPKEKLFSKDFDIEHIIPQSRLFDDSYSNKTLESRSVNLEKGNETAYDYIKNKKGEVELNKYLQNIQDLFKTGKISKAKFNKLKMAGKEIPDDFINRDLRDTQYIAKKAKSILEPLVKNVVSTSGMVTDRLREDWQLIDIMKELNWEKYDQLGLTEIIENRDGHRIKRIKDWTKRNDHRHHAMDALTIAFTKPSYIQYLNNLNAKSDKSGSIYAIEQKELQRDENGKLKFKPPFALNDFRRDAKKQLESILVSHKAKNKVTTININKSKRKGGYNLKKQLTPRGQMHDETIYGSIKQYVTKEITIGASFDEQTIQTVANKREREALLKRLMDCGNDPQKAFTGKNSLDKNPLFIDSAQTYKVPKKVKVVNFETIYTIRKPIGPDLNIEKVIDPKVKKILNDRIIAFGGDRKKAFENLDENPIWLNKEKGIEIKRVSISGISNAQPLHYKKDEKGKETPIDFVSPGNNHHVAIYKDKDGNLEEKVVTFFDALHCVNLDLPVVDKNYKKEDGFSLLFTLKKNDFFVFPDEATGFKPAEIDLLDENNYSLISPNLFRVQKIATYNYMFRHHLETTVEDKNKRLKDKAYKHIRSLQHLNQIVKIRINHIGKIVSIGE